MPSERSISQTHSSPPRRSLRTLIRCGSSRTDTSFACSSQSEFQSATMFCVPQAGTRSSMSQLPLIQSTLICYMEVLLCQDQTLDDANLPKSTQIARFVEPP